mgnify:CR=1 FL=1
MSNEQKTHIDRLKEILQKNGNIIKICYDRELISVDSDGNVQNIDACTWADGSTDTFTLNKRIFRKRIEPWLTSLFQSEHLSLLCGSGITRSIRLLAHDTDAKNMGDPVFTNYEKEIELAAKKSAKDCGRENGNFEDHIRVANDLLRGLKILNKTEEAEKLKEEIDSKISNFAKSILKSEKSIATAIEDKREKAFSVLVNFLLSFASRTGNRERLNIFTTNYDRLIEVGAELAGIHLMDRFVGTVMPIFRSSRLNLDIHYNPPGIRGEPRYLEGVARLTKLHGSVDWVQNKEEIRRIGLPFGAEDIKLYLKAPGLDAKDALKLMIYPNSAKDRETAEYPYVELFRDFAAAICRPNNTLVTYGYGFGDDHINRVIRDMLTIPSTHLVIISYDDPIGRILSFYYNSARYAQISVLMGKELGDITNLTNDYLPKPAIDRNIIRMTELLQRRMGVSSDTNKGSD